MRTREELAWAAGFFDGEGSFIVTKKGNGTVTIGQVDREVLDRFQEAVGLGKVVGPHANGRWAPMHRYRCYTSEHVQAVAAMLWPFLGKVKREQASRTLSTMTRSRPKWKPGESLHGVTCRRGHDQEVHRTKYGQCRACMRLSDQKRRDVR